MKKVLTAILAIAVFFGSIYFPVEANASGTAKKGGCAIRLENNDITLSEQSEAASGSSITISGKSVVVTGPTIVYRYSFTADITNAGSRTASKVVVDGRVGDNSIRIRSGELASDDTESVDVEFNSLSKLSDNEHFIKDAITVYYPSEKDVHRFATSDHYFPVISGFVKSGSYEKIDGEVIPYQTVYKSQKNTYNFKKYVKINDKKAKLTVDTSKVDFDRKGIYTVRYTATDKAGNSSTVTAKIAVRLDNDTLDRYASKVLKSITRKNWSAKRKATAIGNYSNSHIRYSGHHRSYNWESEAIAALRSRNGDCFTYYSLTRALLTRAGIPNIKVKLVHVGRRHHFWNMAYVRGGFYHLDSCPRRPRKKFILLTDAQLRYYATHVERNSHVWDYAHIPKTPKNAISK